MLNATTLAKVEDEIKRRHTTSLEKIANSRPGVYSSVVVQAAHNVLARRGNKMRQS